MTLGTVNGRSRPEGRLLASYAARMSQLRKSSQTPRQLISKSDAPLVPDARTASQLSCHPWRSCEVDDESITHILVYDAVERRVDLLRTNQLDVGRDLSRGTVVDQFLRFGNAADH